MEHLKWPIQSTFCSFPARTFFPLQTLLLYFCFYCILFFSSWSKLLKNRINGEKKSKIRKRKKQTTPITNGLAIRELYSAMLGSLFLFWTPFFSPIAAGFKQSGSLWSIRQTLFSQNFFPTFSASGEALSVDITRCSEQLLYVSPVLLSTHVSSQDQRRICGLEELPVSATLAPSQTYIVLHAALESGVISTQN